MAEAVVFAHDLVLRAVAHAGSGDGELSACRARHQAQHRRDAQPRFGRRVEDDRATRSSRSSTDSRCGSKGCAGSISDVLALALGNRRAFVIGFMAFVIASFGLAPLPGRELLPGHRWRRNLSACPRADRHPHRGNRGPVRPYRTEDPLGHPARPAGFDRRQYRPAGQRHQPRLFQRRRRGTRGWRHSDYAERQSRCDRGLREDPAHGPAAHLPGLDLLPSCPPISSARS